MDPVSDDALHREVEFDLLSAAFQLDPPATFAALRDQLPQVRPNGAPSPVKAAVLKGFETLPIAWG